MDTPPTITTPSPAPSTPPPAALCPTCGYDRAGLPDNAHCPECNAPAPPPAPATEPVWLELLVRTTLRPRVLWAELVPRTNDGALLLSNAIAGTALFSSAALIYAGILLFIDVWRAQGPYAAMSILFVGIFIAALLTLFIATGVGLAVALAAVVITGVLRAVIAPFVPVRGVRSIRGVAAHALFAPIAWGLAAWAVVILFGLLALLLLTVGAQQRTEEGFLIAAAFLNLVIAGAAVLHMLVLMIWGVRDLGPPTPSG